MPRPHAPLAALAALLLVIGCSSDDDGSDDPAGAPPADDRPPSPADDAPLVPADGTLRATIRRTTGGVPHVRGDDLASVAYGAGFAQAEDNVCLIAEAVLKARGERALFFGPGEGNANVTSDFSYRALAADDGAAFATLSAASRALLDGFAAGYNRHVAETAPADLPPACREQPWVRPITTEDLYAHYRLVAQYASGDLFAGGALLAAVPPGVSPEPTVIDGDTDGDGDTEALGAIDPARIGADFARGARESRGQLSAGLASNAWGIGRTLSAGGRGALLANPHFPYTGTRRLYQMHLTVPGHYDVNGAGLIGTTLPLIGFNRHVAWSHTVSTSRRFTLYELTLADGDPRTYVKDGETVPLESRTIRIEVADGDGTPTVLEREVWFSEHGPMLAADLVTGGALPAWGANGTAYTYRDANAGAATLLDTWLGLGRAADLDGFRAVFESCGSTLWTNTVYADDAGETFYIDSSSVPHLSDETLAALEAKRAASEDFARLFANGLTLLDGSTSRDDWVDGDCGALVPYAERPTLAREDFVQNSNSSYRWTNPAEPLDGYSPLFGGTDERVVNARTQLGLRMLRAPGEPGFAPSAPAGQDGRFDARELLGVIWNDRALHAELWLPELRERCALIGDAAVSLPAGGSRPVDAGCRVLVGWDGLYDIDSVGAHVFRVFLARLFARDDVARVLGTDALESSDPADSADSAEPLDPVDPTFALDPTDRGGADDPFLQSLASALDALDASAIAYDATLGSVQTWTPSGGVPPDGAASAGGPVALADPIAWHGGDGNLDGAFNAVGVVTSPVAEDTRFPRLAPVTRPATGGLSTTPGEGWAIGRGTSWHFGLEFTDEGPEAYGLVSYSQSSDPRSEHFVDQSLDYSAKRPRRLLHDEADIAADVLPGGERELSGTLAVP